MIVEEQTEENNFNINPKSVYLAVIACFKNNHDSFAKMWRRNIVIIPILH
jgi:hypothetical protein